MINVGIAEMDYSRKYCIARKLQDVLLFLKFKSK